MTLHLILNSSANRIKSAALAKRNDKDERESVGLHGEGSTTNECLNT